MEFFSMDMLNSILGIVIALFILGILVAVHEAGHLLMAKWSNVRVDTFSIGMGKPIWGFQYGETYYQIGMLPFGGFCGFGEETPGQKDTDPRALSNSPLWARLLTIIGGSLFNMIFALLLMSILFGVGFQEWQLTNQVYVYPSITNPQTQETVVSPAWNAGIRSGDIIVEIDNSPVNKFFDIPLILSYSSKQNYQISFIRNKTNMTGMITPISDPITGLSMIGVKPVQPSIISKVLPDSPAERAGLQSGDKIVSINNQPVEFFYQVADFVLSNNVLKLEFQRNGKIHVVKVMTTMIDGVRQMGISAEYPKEIVVHSKAANIFQAFAMAWNNISSTISQILSSLVKLFSGQLSVQDNLSGPVRIISVVGDVASTFNFPLIIKFVTMLSLALAVFNLLPFPGLDGGALVLTVLRSGFKNSEKAEKVFAVIEQIGILFLIFLAALVFVNDIKNLVRENKQEQSSKSNTKEVL